MKKLLQNYKYTLICSPLGLFLIIFIILIMILTTVIINIFAIQQLVQNANHVPFNVTLINIKNTSFDIPNEIYIKYDFYFYYTNETIRNATILCKKNDCVNIYSKYKMKDTLILYLYDDKFKFETNISVLIVFIVMIPVTISFFAVLLCIVIIFVTASIFWICFNESSIEKELDDVKKIKSTEKIKSSSLEILYE